MNRIGPLRNNFGSGGGGWYPATIRTGAGDRLTVRRNQTLQPGVRRPSNGYAALRATQTTRYALVPTRQHQCKRTGPETCREIRRCRREMQAESRYHGGVCNEEQEGLFGRPPLELHQRFNPIRNRPPCRNRTPFRSDTRARDVPTNAKSRDAARSQFQPVTRMEPKATQQP